MKYNIHINQFCWEKNDFKSLDIIDLALFDAIRCFMISSKAETIAIDRQVYYWVSPDLLIKEMPLLGITTPRGINKRLENLIDAKLLERCPNNQSIKRSYFKMGEKYNLYMCSNENDGSSLGTIVPTPTWNGCSKENNTIIDNNYIEKKNIKEKIEDRESAFKASVQEYATKYPQSMLNDFVRYWTEPNASKTKMRFEMQPTFEIGRRLVTWNNNNKTRYNEPTSLFNQPKQKKSPWEELGMSEEMYKSTILGK